MGMAFQDLIDTVVDQCMKIPIAEKRDDRFGIMMQKVISDEIPVCPPAAKQERSSKNESNPVVEEIPKHEPPEDKADEAVTGENGSANLSSSINGSPIKFEVSSIKEEPNVVPSMTSSTSNYNLQCSTPVSDEPRPSKTLCENINFDSQSNLSSSSHSPVTDSAYYSKHPDNHYIQNGCQCGSTQCEYSLTLRRGLCSRIPQSSSQSNLVYYKPHSNGSDTLLKHLPSSLRQPPKLLFIPKELQMSRLPHHSVPLRKEDNKKRECETESMFYLPAKKLFMKRYDLDC